MSLTLSLGARAALVGAVVGAAAFAATAGAPALGHDKHQHQDSQQQAPAEETAVSPSAEPAQGGAAAEPFPVDIGGDFALVDHTGQPVTDADYRGRYMLVFFGYAQCDSICPVGLKRMTDAVDLLGASGERVQPILISVDPENDTPEALAAHLPAVHPRLVGLTGTTEAVAAAMKSYKVNAKVVGQSWKGTPVISHGSYIYLMGTDGALLSVLPPVLSPEAMAGIIEGYLSQS